MDSNTSRPNAQGYSDFFTSGLRAMTGRDRRRRRTKAKSVDLTHVSNRSSFWTDEYFEIGRGDYYNPFSGRRRHASMIIGGTMNSNGSERDSSLTAKKRRSGLSSFSARWFSRAKEPVSSPSIPPATHDEDDDLYADDEKEQTSLSIECPSLPSLHERSPPIDPYPSWSDSPSSNSPFKFERKRVSFLSLNSSSSNVSSFLFPAVPRSHPTFAECLNPLIPSPYTQSSSSSWDREEEERGDEETPVETPYTTSEDQETCDWDAPSRIDWRQFHVHLLQIANDGTKL